MQRNHRRIYSLRQREVRRAQDRPRKHERDPKKQALNSSEMLSFFKA